MTVAKRDGRMGMAASLGGAKAAIMARSVRHSTLRKWPKSRLASIKKKAIPDKRGYKTCRLLAQQATQTTSPILMATQCSSSVLTTGIIYKIRVALHSIIVLMLTGWRKTTITLCACGRETSPHWIHFLTLGPMAPRGWRLMENQNLT